MKKILVTGATGFIGKHCITPLLQKNYTVHATYFKDHPTDERVSWHETNLLDIGQSTELIKTIKPSHLLHLAWFVNPGECLSSPKNIDFLMASYHLIDQFVQSGGNRVVVSGSCSEYMDQNNPCAENTTPLAPPNLYGCTKLSLYRYIKTLNVNFAWPRIFFTYGPNEHPNRLIPYVIRSLLSKQPAKCTHGKQIRDYLYVEDVADALVSILDSNIRDAINVASGSHLKLQDLIIKIAKRMNLTDLIQLGALPTRPNEPKSIIANVYRLTKELDWRPKYSLEKGLEKTINWWKHEVSGSSQAQQTSTLQHPTSKT